MHSVSMICDGAGSGNKHNSLFTEDFGVVVPAGVFDEILETCKHIARYPRKGGLYVSKMRARNPKGAKKSSFTRPGAKR